MTDGKHLTSNNNNGNNHNKLLATKFIDSKERLSDIINFLPDATFVIDSASRVIAWNLAMEEMTKVKANDMLGKDNYEYSLHSTVKEEKFLLI